MKLDYDTYKLIERSLPALFVTENTTPVQVAYHNGIQAVLTLLREKYVAR